MSATVKRNPRMTRRWEGECGAPGWMAPAMRGKFPDLSLAGLVREARRIHTCADPDICSVSTQEEMDSRKKFAEMNSMEFGREDIF